MNIRFTFLTIILLSLSIFSKASSGNDLSSSPVNKAKGFIENKGQFDSNSEFSSGPQFELIDKDGDIQIFKNGFSCVAGSNQISQIFTNTNPNANIITEGKTQHYFSYGPAKWNAHGYASITIQNIYPNIDLRYEVRPEISSGFKYSLLLKPGSNLNDIHWEIKGAAPTIWNKDSAISLKSERITVEQNQWIVFVPR